MQVWVYNRFGAQIGCLHEFTEFAWDDEAGKIETVEFTVMGQPLEKGDYLVWRDEFLNWHEDVVSSAEVIHSGAVTQHVYAEDSLVELNLSYIDERNSFNKSNSLALQTCLEQTRWGIGTVDPLGLGDIKFYHSSVYEGLVALQKTFGGEFQTAKKVDRRGVYERTVSWREKRGSDHGLQFAYGFDAGNIGRHVELDDVYTRLHVFGKGEPTFNEKGEQTGNGRRLTFKDINGGRDYLEDASLIERWGVIGKDGAKVHAEGTAIFEDCEDPAELLRLGEARFKEVSQPRVTYTADVVVLADAGMDFKNAMAGDVVHIRDEVLDERLSGRVMRIRRYPVGSRATEITLGNVVRTMADVVSEQRSRMDSLSDRSGSWDGAANAGQAWLDNMMAQLNGYFDQAGGYVEINPETGITVYDRPSDQNPTMAIQINGMGFRIANSKASDGNWNWRTFGTGDGFTADLINAGRIQGPSLWIDMLTGEAHFEHGGIYDQKGNFQIDMDAGTFTMKADAMKVDGKSLAEYVSSEADLTQESVFNALTNNGNAKGMYIQNGQLYLSATYIGTGTMAADRVRTGILTDAAGNSTWDLTNSTLTTRNINAQGVFSCGPTTSLLTIEGGQIKGTRNGTQIGVIDYTAQGSASNVYGLRLNGNAIKIETNSISITRSVNEALAFTAKTVDGGYLSNARWLSDGVYEFTWRHYEFRNGICLDFAGEFS